MVKNKYKTDTRKESKLSMNTTTITFQYDQNRKLNNLIIETKIA